MPTPSLTANSPAAGAISWSAFSIAYGGKQRTIPAGSTTSRFTWWRWRNGAPAISGGATRTNLATNPSLETNTTNWANTAGATPSRQTSGGYVGPAHYRAVCDGTAGDQGFIVASVSSPATVANYTGRVALRQISGTRTIRVWLRITYTDATTTEGASTSVVPGTDWAEFTTPTVAAAGGKTVSTVHLHVRSTGTGTAFTLDGDAVLIEPAATVGPYFDGAQSGSAWTGTAHASTSTQANGGIADTGVGILETGAALPVELTSDDLVLFINRNGTPINIQNTNIVDGSIIVTESIVGDSIAANTITGTKLIADTISAREIGAGAITARSLSLSTISADEIPNGSLEDVATVAGTTGPVPSAWTPGYERTGTPTYSQNTATPISGTSSTVISVPANGVEGMASAAIPCAQAESIYFATAFSTSVAGAPITVRAYFGTAAGFTSAQKIATTPALPTNVAVYTLDGNLVATPANPAVGAGIAALLEGWAAPAANTTYVVIGHVRVPAGARFARLMGATGLASYATAHATTFDSFESRPLVVTTSIADGAITTRTITVGTLNGDRITAGTLTADRIATSTLSSRTITLGSDGILAIASGGQIVVGNTTSGWRADNTGQKFYSDGELKVNLPVTGSPTFKGEITGSTITGSTFRTATSGDRVEMGPTVVDGVPGVLFVQEGLRSSIRNNGGLAMFSDQDNLTGRPALILSRDGNVSTLRGDLVVLQNQSLQEIASFSRTLGSIVRSTWTVQSTSGYVDIGPQNTSYCHFSTDRPAFYLNKEVQVDGTLRSYGTTGQLSWTRNTTSGSYDQQPAIIRNDSTISGWGVGGANGIGLLSLWGFGLSRCPILGVQADGALLVKDANGAFEAVGAKGFFATSNGVYYGSSRELKQNIRALGSKESAAVKAVAPRRFQYTDNPDVEQLGFVAEELDKFGLARRVHAVKADPEKGIQASEGALALDPMHLVAVLWQAVRELSTAHDALAARLVSR